MIDTTTIIEPAKVEAIEKDTQLVLAEGKTLVITDPATNAAAAQFLVKVKVRLKRLEDMRTEITKPLNEALRATNNRFKMFSEPLSEIEHVVKAGMGQYAAEEEAKAAAEFARLEKARLEEERKKAKAEEEARLKQEEAARLAREATNAKQRAEAEAKAKEAEAAKKAAEKMTAAPVAVEKPKTDVRTEGGLVHTKKVWAFEVADPALVPKCFWVIDERLLRKAIQEGEREIPGVRVFQETQVAAKTF